MIRLVESNSFSKSDLEFINHSVDLLENNTGKKYSCIACYRVPISKFDVVNSNGRVYPRALWENVIKNQKHIWDGCLGLADHPAENEEGSVKNVFGVWKNLHIKNDSRDNNVYADLYLVGPYGKLAHEILQAGGKIGFSTSGFGDLKENGYVDPVSYLLERVSDWVLNPSQGVFGTLEMEIKENIQKLDKSDNIFTVNSTNIKDKKFDVLEKENTELIMDKDTKDTSLKLSKIEEKRLLKDIQEFFEEAKKVENPLNKKKEFENLLSYLEPYSSIPEIKVIQENIQKEIAETEKEINDSLNKQKEYKDILGSDDPVVLKEKIKEFDEEVKKYEKKLDNYRTIIGNLQNTIKELSEESSKKKTLEKALQEMKEKYVSISKETEELKEKNKQLKKAAVTALLKNKKYNLFIKELIKEHNELREKFFGLIEKKNEKIKQYDERVKQLSEKLKKYEEIEKMYKEKELEEQSLEVKPIIRNKSNYFSNELFVEDEVKEYVEDLKKIHGEKLNPYIDKLLQCKTLFEASKLYTDILAEIDRYPILETNDPILRKKFVENTTGVKVAVKKGLTIPKGWE